MPEVYKLSPDFRPATEPEGELSEVGLAYCASMREECGNCDLAPFLNCVGEVLL